MLKKRPMRWFLTDLKRWSVAFEEVECYATAQPREEAQGLSSLPPAGAWRTGERQRSATAAEDKRKEVETERVVD